MTPFVFHLVQANEGGVADVVLLQVGDAQLRRVDGVHHDVVKGATAGGNGHVVLLIDGTKVPLRVQDGKKKKILLDCNNLGCVHTGGESALHQSS